MKTLKLNSLVWLVMALAQIPGTEISAQDEKEMKINKCVRLSTGPAMGIITPNDNGGLIYGGFFQYSYNIKPIPRFGIGAGVGIHFYSKESFIPFYLNSVFFLSCNKNAPFIDLQLGYSVGWSSRYEEYSRYDFKGGPHIGGGIGKKVHTGEYFSIFLELEYKHQFAYAEYRENGQDIVTDNLNYSMFAITVGLMLKQD